MKKARTGFGLGDTSSPLPSPYHHYSFYCFTLCWGFISLVKYFTDRVQIKSMWIGLIQSYSERSFDKKGSVREQRMPGGWRGEKQGTENRDLELEPKNTHQHNSCAEGRLSLQVHSYDLRLFSWGWLCLLWPYRKDTHYCPLGPSNSGPVQEVDNPGAQSAPLPSTAELVTQIR